MEYQVFKDGTILNKRGKSLKPSLNQKGYLTVQLRLKGTRLKKAVHRLVAETYLGPIPEGYEVDHIDGNRLNNDLSNLQILSVQANKEKAHAKHWQVQTPTGEIVDVYNLAKFCREHGLDRSHMANVLYGKYQHHKGYCKP